MTHQKGIEERYSADSQVTFLKNQYSYDSLCEIFTDCLTYRRWSISELLLLLSAYALVLGSFETVWRAVLASIANWHPERDGKSSLRVVQCVKMSFPHQEHNTIFFDVNFQEEHFLCLPTRLISFSCRASYCPLTFKLFLRHMPGTFLRKQGRRELRDQISAVCFEHFWVSSLAEAGRREVEQEVLGDCA